MENRAEIPLAEQFAATIAWWRDAGVDYEFVDAVAPFLSDEDDEKNVHTTSPGKKPEVEEVPEPKVRTADLPANIAEFHDWWVGPDNPFAAGHAARLAPSGKEGAPIMVMVAMPESEDRDSLLAGPQGRLVNNILRAIGIDPNAVYFASALPSHMPLPDWSGLGTDGLGTVLSHHVRLARPQRVLLFGSKLPALLGHDPAAPPETFSAIADTPSLATFAPDRLLDHARQRARLWKRLCQWTAPL